MPWWLLWKRTVRGEDVDRLKGWKSGGPSLAGGNFLGVRLPRRNLRGIDFSKANLNEADLRKADLVQASLRGTALNHANLKRANLRWASLSGAELVGTNLQGANLAEVNLSGVRTRPNIPEDLKLAEARSTTTTFRGANLQHANLCGADLRGADLRGADLRHAHYSDQTSWPEGVQPHTEGAIIRPSASYNVQRSIRVPGYGELPMGWIPPSTFLMGAADDDKNAGAHEKPSHNVLPRSISLGRTQVTQGLYRAITGANPSKNKTSDQHPVEYVSWFDAVRFCNALSKACGLEQVYTIGKGEQPAVTCNFQAHGFRLPTEAEWECAAKAGQDLMYSGSDNPDEVAWYDENSGKMTHPVAQKKPNAWGLYDMSGNVWEWCWDWYDKDEYKNRHLWSIAKKTAISSPEGPQRGVYRLLRGSSSINTPWYLRSTCRRRSTPVDRTRNSGFRVALSSPAPV